MEKVSELRFLGNKIISVYTKKTECFISKIYVRPQNVFVDYKMCLVPLVPFPCLLNN